MKYLEKKQQLELKYLISYKSDGRTRFGYSEKNVTDREGFILVYPCEKLNPEDDGFGIMVKPLTIKYSPSWEKFELKSIKDENLRNWVKHKENEKKKIGKFKTESKEHHFSVESEIKAIISLNYEPLIILLNEKYPDLTIYNIFLVANVRPFRGFGG